MTYVLPLTIMLLAWQALESFRTQEVDFLIATDVAARVSAWNCFLRIDFLLGLVGYQSREHVFCSMFFTCSNPTHSLIRKFKGFLHCMGFIFVFYVNLIDWVQHGYIPLLWPFSTVFLVTDLFHMYIQGLDIVGVETVINFHCPADITM